MPQGVEGMPIKHPRTCILHHFPDAPAHLRLKTVNLAARADRLCGTEGTSRHPFFNVFPQRLTVGTWLGMMMPAEYPDHRLYGPDFPGCTVRHGQSRRMRLSFSLGFYEVVVDALHLVHQFLFGDQTLLRKQVGDGLGLNHHGHHEFLHLFQMLLPLGFFRHGSHSFLFFRPACLPGIRAARRRVRAAKAGQYSRAAVWGIV
jgi:hypothetical protein